MQISAPRARPPLAALAPFAALALLASSSLSLPSAAAASPAAATTVFGADLGEVTWSAGEAAMPFADLVKQCSPFEARRWSPAARAWSWESAAAIIWSTAANASLGPGLPLRLVGGGAGLAAVCTIGAARSADDPVLPPSYLAGDYVLLFDGVGNVTVTGDASVAASSGGLSSAGGFALRIDAPRSGLSVAITASGQLSAAAAYSADDVVRNVRILPAAAFAAAAAAAGGGNAGAAAAAAAFARGPASFSPIFLALARRLPALRFAGWQKQALTIYSPPSNLNWAGRPLPSWPSQAASGAGVALEHAVDLALAANASAWLSVPQGATADYTAELAALLATSLVLAPATPWPAPRRFYLQWSAEPGFNMDIVAPQAFAAVTAIESGLRLALLRLGRPDSDFGALRVRFVLVADIQQPGYLAHYLDAWAAATAAAAVAAGNAPSSAAATKHPFARINAVAFRAELGTSAVVTGPGWEFSSTNITYFMALSDAQLLRRLHRSLLDAELAFVGLANRFALFAANASRLGLRAHLAGSRSVDYVAGLPSPPALLAYGAGFAFRAPDFGARTALYNLQRSAPSNVTQAMLAAASLETAFATRLIALHRRPEIRNLTRDAFARLQAAGFAAVLAPDLMRPASGTSNAANFAFWLALRRSGNSAASEGWAAAASSNNFSAAAAAPLLSGSAGDAGSVAAFVDSVVAASPTLAALLEAATAAAAALAAGQPPPAPLTAADFPAAAEPAPAACAGSCIYGTCAPGGSSCVCFNGAFGAACDSLAQAGDPRGGAAACGAPNLGMNVGGVADYSTQLLYVDAMKQARSWIAQAGYQYSNLGWEWGDLAALDAADNPLAIGPGADASSGVAVGTMLLRDLRGHYPRGVFLVAWDGDGVVEASMEDVVSVVRDAPGRMRVTLLPGTGLNNGLFLRILRSSAANPVRNLRVIMPFPGAAADPALLAQPDADTLPAYSAALAQAAAFPFHPALLAFLRNYSTLRFMDLLATNSGVTPATWATRVLPAHRTFALGRGIPIEHVALLSNTLGAHAHVNVPHTGDDGYVRGMATMLRNTLRPDLNVYIEYANEVCPLL